MILFRNVGLIHFLYLSLPLPLLFFHSPHAIKKLILLHVNSNQCLDKATEEDSQVPSIKDCNGSRSQQWLLRNVTLPEIFWRVSKTRIDWTTSASAFAILCTKQRLQVVWSLEQSVLKFWELWTSHPGVETWS